VENDGASPSAVLVVLYEADGGLHVVLTRRSWDLRTHRGEVSFPGGRTEEGETPSEAALRESWEEIALDTGAVEVLGEMDHLTTVTRRAYVVPVVGVLPEKPDVALNPDEVDEVLFVPLTDLVQPDVFREERWGLLGSDRPIYFFEIDGDTIWGATAALLRQFLANVLGLDPGSDIDLDPARGITSDLELTPEQQDGVV
jgi:8-oxo-dGTP pyrophosphatase MutT (NUDIX family)